MIACRNRLHKCHDHRHKETSLPTLLVTLTCATGLARESPANAYFETPVPYDDLDAIYASDAPYVIFLNLDRTSSDLYNSNDSKPLPIADSRVSTVIKYVRTPAAGRPRQQQPENFLNWTSFFRFVCCRNPRHEPVVQPSKPASR